MGGRKAVKVFAVDEVAKAAGVSVLRLPPYHCILNPIEHYWAYLKAQLGKRTTGREKLEELKNCALKIIEETPPEMRKRFYESAEHEEDAFIHKENLIFIQLQDGDELVEVDEEDILYESDNEISYMEE